MKLLAVVVTSSEKVSAITSSDDGGRPEHRKGLEEARGDGDGEMRDMLTLI